uniref:protein CHROMATIN REMODELING 4-like n=1 Tax=Erigeron canadensis TaxID=72917 RepID=UPI001CB9CD41|nr:protein CHROMATIN REMODELING 4-like [Erigeron canadensis]
MGEPANGEGGIGGACAICMDGGELLLCSGQGCRRSFHRSCLDPPICHASPGPWLCALCTKNMIKPGSSALSEFQFEVSSEIGDHVLPYVNKLRDYWHRGQNAVIFDGQDRLVKVVFFVLSLLENVRQPILITVASSILSSWEAEFSKWSKPTTVVTYKGNKDTRAAIRASEFYSEKGTVRFQVLLSSPDVIVEDMESFGDIKWELIVIDECQRYTISTHSKKVNRLVADMKLLTVTGETVDMNCRYILSLLDYKFEDMDMDADMENDNVTHALKERLSPFIAFECKFDTTEFEEHWVPVHLSSMQIEQYCTILDSNMKALSSCKKNSPSTQNIFIQTSKCCDHPYLVDPTLHNSSESNSSVDPVAAKIHASGKMHILYKLLLEIKRSGLRVLVLFQPAESSESISLGDILEDLLHQRFGQDSYVHIQSARKKRVQALKMFNRVENAKFVCLLDKRACNLSIRLSRVDLVILYNSKLNPSYDTKFLHKITFYPHRGPLKVLRLYSSFTVEEKALILSKQRVHLDRIGNVSCKTLHQLLTWGASFQFSKLQIQTDSKDLLSESAFIDDLLHEFLSLLKAINEKTGPTKGSVISNAQLYDEFYSTNIMLLGEAEAHTKESSSVNDYLIENGPAFWRKILKERRQRRKNLGRRSSQRVQSHSYLLEGFGTSLFIKTKPRSKRKVLDKSEQRKWGGLPAYFGGHQSSDISHTLDQECHNSQPPHASSSTPLVTEIEIQKEREKVRKSLEEQKSMLLFECEKELLEVRKKYDTLIQESGTSLRNQLKNLDECHELVIANKLLAEILAQNFDDNLNAPVLEKAVNDTSSIKVLEIPVSALVRPMKPYSTSGLATCFSGHSLGGTGLRAPAPHLRSNPSLFASSVHTTSQLHQNQLFISHSPLSTPQTLYTNRI